MREHRNRVVQLRHFGGPEGLEVVDAPMPVARGGEVRVRVLASGLEYTDVVIRRHLYPQTMHRRPPFVLGYDVVGEIEQLGDGVTGFQLGDRVADMTVLGSNAAYRTLRAEDVVRVPAGLDAAEAALWPSTYISPLSNSTPCIRKDRISSKSLMRLSICLWKPSIGD